MILHTRSFSKRTLRSLTVWLIVGSATISVSAYGRHSTRNDLTLSGAQVGSQAQQAKNTRRTITNKDLEKFRTARLRSEAQYEKRRKELGLPTVEEHRLRSIAQVESDTVFTNTMRAREYDSEKYWRSRASDLRSQLVATNARIDFVRARLNELPTGSDYGFVTPFSSFVQPGFGWPASGFYGNRSGRWSQQNRARVTFGQSYYGGWVPARPFFPFSPSSIYGSPYEDNSYERSMLITQLDDLLGKRAALQARWRDLEEEARRAGAYPGWLRP
ncbi:MAG TPA: hypothetical protein VIG25_25200 [Pyrinomonadaceae bacterium]